MRKIVLMCLLTMMSNSAMAGWVECAGDKDSSINCDSTTIRIDGNRVKMWVLNDYKKVIAPSYGKPYLSTISQMEFDCKEEQIRGLYFSNYSGNMGSGELIYSDTDSTKWVPVVPRSTGEYVWKFACGIK